MAKGGYIGIDGVSRKSPKNFLGIEGVTRKNKKAYLSESGVAREWFTSGVPINTLDVGSSVYLNIGGIRTEFLIIHKGLPSSVYDSSCDGTWLLMKDVYVKRVWNPYNGGNYNNDYENSDIHSYLNNTFINLLDTKIQTAIKQVKIPYRKGAEVESYPQASNGANGLLTKAFLLSYTEVGLTGDYSYRPTEGAKLDYFNGATNDKRIAKLDGTAILWWLRTPYTAESTHSYLINESGAKTIINAYGTYGVRPTMILNSSALVDTN